MLGLKYKKGSTWKMDVGAKVRKRGAIMNGADVLVLNADGMPLGLLPISAISWREAIKKIWNDEATVLHVYEDWIVRSPSISMNVPSVIVLKEHHRPKTMVRFSRKNVFLRDEFTCQYCNEEFNHHDLTYDHVIPQSKGGKTTWTNIATACSPCNRKRGCNGKIRPKKEPYRPTYWEMVAKITCCPIVVPHETWKFYLNWEPDLITVSEKKK